MAAKKASKASSGASKKVTKKVAKTTASSADGAVEASVMPKIMMAGKRGRSFAMEKDRGELVRITVRALREGQHGNVRVAGEKFVFNGHLKDGKLPSWVEAVDEKYAKFNHDAVEEFHDMEDEDGEGASQFV